MPTIHDMPKTNNIQFQVSEHSSYITTVHNAIGGEIVDDNTLFFEKEHPIVNGIIKTYTIREGLRVLIAKDLFLKKPLVLIRSNGSNNAFITCKIYLLDKPIHQKLRTSKGEDLKTEEGVLFSSSSSPDISNLPIGQTFSVFCVVLTKKWFKEDFQVKEGEDLYNVLTSDCVFSMTEKLPNPILNIVKEIVQIELNSSFEKLSLEAKVMEFTLWALKILSQKENIKPSINIKKQDLEAVQLIHQMLIENLDKSLSINTLSREAAMSESKLKILFKQVYGMSIRQYIINYRMEKAYEMLVKEKRQIGEVSTALGYANQSQFTQTFKEYFAILPTEVFKKC
jgi:AraC-like DNA-binding protein